MARHRDPVPADPAPVEPELNGRSVGVAVQRPVLTPRPEAGPHDGDALEPEEEPAAGVTDFGAIRVPLPAGGVPTVEPPGAGGTHALHVALAAGRLSVSALAAPKSSRLWPELVKEIEESLKEGGATVRSFTGDWGRELHATTGSATSVFVGVDGPRWMLYGVATGSTAAIVTLDEELRRMLRSTVVVRGSAPYPVRTVLPLTTPPHLAAAAQPLGDGPAAAGSPEPEAGSPRAGSPAAGLPGAGSPTAGPQDVGSLEAGPRTAGTAHPPRLPAPGSSVPGSSAPGPHRAVPSVPPMVPGAPPAVGGPRPGSTAPAAPGRPAVARTPGPQRATTGARPPGAEPPAERVERPVRSTPPPGSRPPIASRPPIGSDRAIPPVGHGGSAPGGSRHPSGPDLVGTDRLPTVPPRPSVDDARTEPLRIVPLVAAPDPGPGLAAPPGWFDRTSASASASVPAGEVEPRGRRAGPADGGRMPSDPRAPLPTRGARSTAAPGSERRNEPPPVDAAPAATSSGRPAIGAIPASGTTSDARPDGSAPVDPRPPASPDMRSAGTYVPDPAVPDPALAEPAVADHRSADREVADQLSANRAPAGRTARDSARADLTPADRSPLDRSPAEPAPDDPPATDETRGGEAPDDGLSRRLRRRRAEWPYAGPDTSADDAGEFGSGARSSSSPNQDRAGLDPGPAETVEPPRSGRRHAAPGPEQTGRPEAGDADSGGADERSGWPYQPTTRRRTARYRDDSVLPGGWPFSDGSVDADGGPEPPRRRHAAPSTGPRHAAPGQAGTEQVPAPPADASTVGDQGTARDQAAAGPGNQASIWHEPGHVPPPDPSRATGPDGPGGPPTDHTPAPAAPGPVPIAPGGADRTTAEPARIVGHRRVPRLPGPHLPGPHLPGPHLPGPRPAPERDANWVTSRADAGRPGRRAAAEPPAVQSPRVTSSSERSHLATEGADGRHSAPGAVDPTERSAAPDRRDEPPPPPAAGRHRRPN